MLLPQLRIGFELGLWWVAEYQVVVLEVEIAELGLAEPEGMDVSIDLPRKLLALDLVAIFIG